MLQQEIVCIEYFVYVPIKRPQIIKKLVIKLSVEGWVDANEVTLAVVLSKCFTQYLFIFGFGQFFK